MFNDIIKKSLDELIENESNSRFTDFWGVNKSESYTVSVRPKKSGRGMIFVRYQDCEPVETVKNGSSWWYLVSEERFEYEHISDDEVYFTFHSRSMKRV